MTALGFGFALQNTATINRAAEQFSVAVSRARIFNR